MKGFFVTGTDTGVGKTVVSCALIAALSRRGLRVAPMKPCETGGGDDALRLLAASGRALTLDEVSPYRFPLPASPEEAARAAQSRVQVDRIQTAYRRLTRDADVALVEGAGGLLVPLAEGVFMADLARTLELPLLIVARPSLGTVNHTLLTVEAAQRRGLRVLGVIFSRTVDEQGPDEPTNPHAIAFYGEVEVLGSLPRIDDQAPSVLAGVAEEHIKIERLLSLLEG